MNNQTLPASQRLWRYGPLALWIVFISFASTSEFSATNTSEIFRPLLLWFFPNLSEPQLATAHFLTRKAGHFTEYAVLAFFARRAFVSSSRTFLRRYWFQAGLALVVIYALLDEFHQSFVPSRTPSIYDSAIDVAGGLAVLIIFKLCCKTPRESEVSGQAEATSR
jgi:VanZ family protein